MTNPLEHRLAELAANGATLITSDDITEAGALTLDNEHKPNSGQNGIGAFFNQAAKRGLIRDTGRVIRSSAPHRKGGKIGVWEITDIGQLWARSILPRERSA